MMSRFTPADKHNERRELAARAPSLGRVATIELFSIYRVEMTLPGSGSGNHVSGKLFKMMVMTTMTPLTIGTIRGGISSN
jgi:hypothetical protein